MKKIDVAELEVIFGKIINKLKSEEIYNIEIESDLYRFIPTDKWDSYDDDEILTGSLFDDLDSLKLILKDSNRMVTFVDFDRLASILRIISEKYNSPNV